jgi:hypothetical protein
VAIRAFGHAVPLLPCVPTGVAMGLPTDPAVASSSMCTKGFMVEIARMGTATTDTPLQVVASARSKTTLPNVQPQSPSVLFNSQSNRNHVCRGPGIETPKEPENQGH